MSPYYSHRKGIVNSLVGGIRPNKYKKSKRGGVIPIDEFTKWYQDFKQNHEGKSPTKAIFKKRFKGGDTALFRLGFLSWYEVLESFGDKCLKRRHTDGNGINLDEEIKTFIGIFDYFAQNINGYKFNSGYIALSHKRDPNFNERFGNEGLNLYSRVKKKFKEEGGIEKIAQLAIKIRPEIAQYWSYYPRNIDLVKLSDRLKI